ncbi:M48 family metalloprotease [bacterium]|nr:M48 family metalloprotease [bacterium]
MNQGICYLTELSPQAVAGVIATEARKLGYVFTQPDFPPDSMCVRMVLAQFRSLIRRLPGHVSWLIKIDGDITRIYCETRLSHLVFAVSLALSILSVLLFWTGIITLSFAPPNKVVLGSLAAAAVSLSALPFVFNYVLIRTCDQMRLSPILEAIRHVAIQSGTYLASDGPGIEIRHQRRIYRYLCFVFLTIGMPALCIMACKLDWHELPLWATVVGCCLIATGLLVPAMLSSVSHTHGYGLRSLLSLPGMHSMMAVFLLLLVQLPWVGLAGHISEKQVGLFRAHQYFRGTWEGTIPMYAEVWSHFEARFAPAYQANQHLGWALLAAGLLFLFMSINFALTALRISSRTLPVLRQILWYPEIESNRKAIASPVFMAKFRWTWSVLWLLMALSLAVTYWKVAESSYYLFSFSSRQYVRSLDVESPVQVAMFLTEMALGTAPWTASLLPCMLVAWLVYLTACWSLLFASIASILFQDYRARRLARAAVSDQTANPLTAVAQRLLTAPQAPTPRPVLVRVDSSMPFACATSHGLLRPKPMIVVSTRCISILDEAELDALIAHELAHHRLGQVRRDYWLRFFGRITFVGDAFVRVLQDSFGYELKADICAVRDFGISPQALKRSLLKMRTVAAMEGLNEVLAPVGVCFQAEDVGAEGVKVPRLSAIQALRAAGGLYLRQFLGSHGWGYWHPSLDHRLAILEDMSARVATPTEV